MVHVHTWEQESRNLLVLLIDMQRHAVGSIEPSERKGARIILQVERKKCPTCVNREPISNPVTNVTDVVARDVNLPFLKILTQY